MKVLVIQSYPTLCEPMDCNPPGSSLCPWSSPGKNTEGGSHSLLWGIFPTQGSNPELQILYPSKEPPVKVFPCFIVSHFVHFSLHTQYCVSAQLRLTFFKQKVECELPCYKHHLHIRGYFGSLGVCLPLPQ